MMAQSVAARGSILLAQAVQRRLQPNQALIRLQSTCSTTNNHSRGSNVSSQQLVGATSETELGVHLINSRMSSLHLTASFLAGNSLAEMERKLPSVLPKPVPVEECPNKGKVNGIVTEVTVPERNRTKEVSDPLVHIGKEILDPLPEGTAPKMAKYKGSRMLKIRKRAMKVHRRKRHAKRHFAVSRRYHAKQAKRKEIVFRTMLLAKMEQAKKYNAEESVRERLEEVFRPLTPATWKGQRFPTWYIKELMAKEQLEKEMREKRKRDLVSGELLVLEGETLDQYKQRIEKSRK